MIRGYAHGFMCNPAWNELWKRYDHNSIYTGYIQGGLGAINLDYISTKTQSSDASQDVCMVVDVFCETSLKYINIQGNSWPSPGPSKMFRS